MDIANTNFQKSTLNNSLGNSPKVDGVIIYTLIRLTDKIIAKYSTNLERRLQYTQVNDIIQLLVFPYLIPKVYRDEWVRSYYKINDALNQTARLNSNLEYYKLVLKDAMELATTILYSNNYYLMEDLSDGNYEELLKQKGEIEYAR